MGFATLKDDGMHYDYFLQKLELGKAVCTKKIEQISGTNLTVYEHWTVLPSVLKLTFVSGPSKAELVTITPTTECDYTFASKPAR